MLLQLCVLVVVALHGKLLVDSASVTSEEVDDRATTFTDQWAVHISGGDQVADAIAARHGFTNLGKVWLVPFWLLLLVTVSILHAESNVKNPSPSVPKNESRRLPRDVKEDDAKKKERESINKRVGACQKRSRHRLVFLSPLCVNTQYLDYSVERSDCVRPDDTLIVISR